MLTFVGLLIGYMVVGVAVQIAHQAVEMERTGIYRDPFDKDTMVRVILFPFLLIRMLVLFLRWSGRLFSVKGGSVRRVCKELISF